MIDKMIYALMKYSHGLVVDWHWCSLYILFSNTLWLLFGSRLLQSLPGSILKGLVARLKFLRCLCYLQLELYVGYLNILLTQLREKK